VREGRLDDVRPCLGCLHCFEMRNRNKKLECRVNATLGREIIPEFQAKPVAAKKKVMVIGGGPAGMEAARVAATRGCDVTLWERSGRLGGKLHLAAAPDFKQNIRPLIRYLSAEVEKAGVKVALKKQATPELVQQHKPDVVIIATGSKLSRPNLPGIEQGHVLSTVDLFEGTKPVGARVLVIGGGLCGCEAAAHLARQGKKVTIVEMAPQLIPEGRNVNTMLAIKALLAESQVEVMTGAKLVEVTKTGVIVEGDNGRRELAGDSVVIATGFTPDLSLRDTLEETVPEVVAIGDCVKPRHILDAIWEGFHAARVID
jgi:2-enoate reductase